MLVTICTDALSVAQNYPHIQIINSLNLELVKGEALLQLRAGDRLDPDAIAELVPLLKHNAGVSFCYTAPRHRQVDGTPTYEDGPAFLHQFVRGQRPVFASGVLMRTHLVRQLGGFPSDYRLLAGQALHLQLALQGWVGYCKRSLVEVTEEPTGDLDRYLNEQFRSLSAAVGELGRYRVLPNRLEGLHRHGAGHIRRQLLVEIRKHRSRAQRIEKLRKLSRYWELRHLPALIGMVLKK